MKKKLFLILTLLMFGAITARAEEVILSVNASGGLCPYGQCHSELLIYADGAGILRQGPDQEKSFTVDPQDLTKLTDLIKATNFEELRQKKFTDVCPTAYDGQKLTYSFSTEQGQEVLDSCATVIDEENPLFKIIQEIQTEAYNSK